MKYTKQQIITIALFFGLFPWNLELTICSAQWSTDPTVNNAICTQIRNQQLPQIISDGSGGAIITWQDNRVSTTNSDIYAQRIDASGNVPWTTDGVAICTATSNQTNPQIVSDGSGGAIITWQDFRSSAWDIYAQRINNLGIVQWTPANGIGIKVGGAAADWYPQLVSDGSGGAIITWQDNRFSAADDNIYARRIDASGAMPWPTADGEIICSASDYQRNPQIVSDGSNGAIITWEDRRNGIDENIYAQRINGSGAVLWAPNGVAICTATGVQYTPQIASDGSNGAIITWYDLRLGGTESDIYARRIDNLGAMPWPTANGEAICTAASAQNDPQIVSDGSAGAIITWWDFRNSFGQIYARRINSSGAMPWPTANGEAICTATSQNPQLASDGSGGAIITWRDYRASAWDIYAQRIDNLGAVQWATNGIGISTATGNQQFCEITVYNCSAIITWRDGRISTTNYHIYAQQIDFTGALGAGDNCPLPIELLTFTATAENESRVRCEWATASETNNDYFGIERSKDGSAFAQIATAPSKAPGGNSSIPLNYGYDDSEPYSGISYYRLRQVDYNGQYSYSEIRAVYIGTTEIISIFPNPASDYIVYLLGSQEGGEITVSLYDALGREVYNKEETIGKGLFKEKIGTQNFASGNYLLRITNGNKEKTQKQFVVK